MRFFKIKLFVQPFLKEKTIRCQELVADLSWETALFQFNWIIQAAHCTPKKAMALTDFYHYWYKEVPKIGGKI